MAKDGSRRSSAAPSTQIDPPRGNNQDGQAQESQQTGGAAADTAEDGPLRTGLAKSSTTNGAHSQAAESQPMSASDSISSNPSTREAASSTTGPAPTYGTRSRNRTGNSRPNYAEDKELDAEFEVASSVKGTGRRSKIVDSSASTDNGHAPSRNVSGMEPISSPAIQAHHKDQIPGTSTFSAIPTGVGTQSKKRKAAAQATTQLHPPLPTQAVTRRASTAVYMGYNVEDSNMLSFESCGGRLKDGKLVADDGTVLQVNGKNPTQFAGNP